MIRIAFLLAVRYIARQINSVAGGIDKVNNVLLNVTAS